ncbi:hypothetical protein BIW11_01183 [Tropilaelaps mercedesae]|uniref:THAP-type domain-containing protein n=1 Tax=Tropilaelaps mercedesae TaxID=418985 RepID=A0A1V9XI23_9ACAR|nr:hypothetical protein BIW11_01183 [Tropilaelaps mercedesae]
MNRGGGTVAGGGNSGDAVRSCCIPGCPSGGFKDGEKLCLFPNDATRRLAWIERIRASGLVESTWIPTASTFVCQAHFDKACFIRSEPNGPLKMAKTAVPSIFNVNNGSTMPNTVKRPGKPPVSIIQTRRAAGITPKPRVLFEADPTPATRRPREGPAAGHTFKPVISRATAGPIIAEVTAPPSSQGGIPPKTTSVVVISADHKPSAAKRSLPLSSNPPPAKKSGLLVGCANCVQLQEKLNQKSGVIRDLEVSISDLKQELNKLDGTREAATSKIDRLKESLKDIYTEHQLTRLTDGTTRGRPWDMETVRRAAKLVLACGRTGYQEILNQGQPFPSLKTLNRLLYKRRYLPSTLDNPDPSIAEELTEELSNTDPEEESDGSTEEIEENIVSGEEGRILKKSRKTRKMRSVMQKFNEAAAQAHALQVGHSLEAMAAAGEEAMLESVAVDGLSGQLLQLHPMDQGQQQHVTGQELVTGEETTTDGSAVALVSHFGQLTVIQDQSTAAQAITGAVIEDILRAQNLTAAEVKEIRVEGSYITIVKHNDALDQDQPMEVPEGAPQHHVSAEESQQLIAQGIIE